MSTRRYSRGNIAPHLKTLRDQAGLTQLQLAERTRVSIASIRRLEAGKKANTSTLEKLATFFGVSISWFVTPSPPP